MTRLFIVDDDCFTCEMLAVAAEPLIDDIQAFYQAQSFLQQTLLVTDIVLLDLQMPDFDGIQTIRLLGEQDCRSSLLLMSGYDAAVLRSAEELAKHYGLNVAANLTKPIDLNLLVELLMLELNKLSRQPLDHINLSTPQVTDINECFEPSKAELQAGIDHDQLVLYYQPQLNFKTGYISGVEALVRWQHPDYGLIDPECFIALAEQYDLIGQLTHRVIAMAVAQSVKWQQSGRQIKISVNISSQNISSLTMPEQLRSLVERHQLDPSLLMLEITESALMDKMITSLDILTRLRLKGFELSIDDFGTGYSSLSQLHQVPFTELKVDKSFVLSSTTDPQSLAIVETCIMLGHKLNMAVVAEGIEDRATFELLERLGCDIGQGFYIGKPMRNDEFERWISNTC